MMAHKVAHLGVGENEKQNADLGGDEVTWLAKRSVPSELNKSGKGDTPLLNLFKSDGADPIDTHFSKKIFHLS